jgi:hypothetical protein
MDVTFNYKMAMIHTGVAFAHEPCTVLISESITMYLDPRCNKNRFDYTLFYW